MVGGGLLVTTRGSSTSTEPDAEVTSQDVAVALLYQDFIATMVSAQSGYGPDDTIPATTGAENLSLDVTWRCGLADRYNTGESLFYCRNTVGITRTVFVGNSAGGPGKAMFDDTDGTLIGGVNSGLSQHPEISQDEYESAMYDDFTRYGIPSLPLGKDGRYLPSRLGGVSSLDAATSPDSTTNPDANPNPYGSPGADPSAPDTSMQPEGVETDPRFLDRP